MPTESERALRLGAVFPTSEIGNDPDDIRRWAQTVEQLGYRHIVAYDHVLGAGADTRPGWKLYTHETPFHEVFVLFGYLAAVTRTVELATGILILPQRQTALVAKQAAQVDVLSGGRMRLGVGVGWNEVEYQGLGESFGNRGARSEEQVELLRALWAEPKITFSGRWHQIDNAGILPRPVRGRIPVWFGGASEATLRRVARIGDGWLPTLEPGATAREMIERLRTYAGQAGRKPEEIGIEGRLDVASVPLADRADFAAAWRDLGASNLTVITMGAGFTSVDEHLEALRETVRAVEPVTGADG
jgi:probable F420-dependent oxidoreductase